MDKLILDLIHSFIPFPEKGPLLLLLSRIHFACQQHFNVFHFFALVLILDSHQQYPSFHYVVSGLLCNLFATLLGTSSIGNGGGGGVTVVCN